jgi:threonine/homoserine/homoserine lactone efflux protein
MDPLYLFVFFGLASPGPNVILITLSGARFGFWATVPHIAGVVFGVGVTAGITGLGVAALLLAAPWVAWMLRLAAAGWILWMAWALWRASAGPSGIALGERPWGIVRATLFQWVNPKLWAVMLTAASGYGLGGSPLQEAQRLAFAFSGVNLFVCVGWTLAGTVLALLLSTPRAWRHFSRGMALALAASAVMVFL